MVLRRGWTPRSKGFVEGRRKEKLERKEREGRELCRFSVLKGGLVCSPTGRGLLLPWLVLV